MDVGEDGPEAMHLTFMAFQPPLFRNLLLPADHGVRDLSTNFVLDISVSNGAVTNDATQQLLRQRVSEQNNSVMSDYDSAAAMAYERMVDPLTGSFAPALLDASGLGPIAGLDVLDAACGSGAVTLCAESQGAIVTACDLSAAMVDRCASRSPSTATAVADVKALPPRWSGRFDLAISNFGVIFCNDLVAGLKEMARCLKPGGVLAFSAWGVASETAGFQLIPQAAAACLPPELAQRVNPLKKRAERRCLRASVPLFSVRSGRAPALQSVCTVPRHGHWSQIAQRPTGLGLLRRRPDCAGMLASTRH